MKMIKNVLFDMGNVVLDYDSLKVVTNRCSDPALIRRIGDVVFRSGEWIMMDAGLMTSDEAIARFKSRLDTDEEKNLAETALRYWPEENLYPHPGIAELVSDLKAAGINVYILSNAHLCMKEIIADLLPNPEDYSGFLFSAEVRYLKPQPEIYLHAFSRFGIVPEESFFVDDLMANIEGGKAVGMDGYCFDGDTAALRSYLETKIPALSNR